MEIKIIKPDSTDVEEIETEHNNSEGLEGDNAGEISKIAVKQVLDIERDDSDYDDDVSTLVKWAKMKAGDDPMDMKWAIRDLQMRLGTPTYGDHIKHLTRFAYLEMEENRIKKEKDSFR